MTIRCTEKATARRDEGSKDQLRPSRGTREGEPFSTVRGNRQRCRSGKKLLALVATNRLVHQLTWRWDSLGAWEHHEAKEWRPESLWRQGCESSCRQY